MREQPRASPPTLIYECLHGSHAYGLARANSDLDLRGLIVGPPEWYLGFRGGPEQVELSADHVRFELRKFFRLAAESNPGAVELLWVEPEAHRVLTPAGERLLAARQLFLSRKVAERFSGYAEAQFRRIQTHRSWLRSPPAEAPKRARFGLPDRSLLPADQLSAAQALLEAQAPGAAPPEFSANFLEVLSREKRFKSAQIHWQQYQTWLKSRNPARAELEARYGYDTKHAMHLVRIQRMALEILNSGKVMVHRPDRAELLAIRDGAWGFEQLEAKVRELATAIQAARAGSPLPEEPDADALNGLCAELIAEVLNFDRPAAQG